MDLPDLDKLEKRAYTRKELQKFAKAMGIRANRRNEDLVSDLREALAQRAAVASTCPPGPVPASPSLAEAKRRELLGALAHSGAGTPAAEQPAPTSPPPSISLPTSPGADCSEILMTVPVDGSISASKVLTPTLDIQRAREAQRDRSHLAQSTRAEVGAEGVPVAKLTEELPNLPADEAVGAPQDESTTLTLTRTAEGASAANTDTTTDPAKSVPSLLIHSVQPASRPGEQAPATDPLAPVAAGASTISRTTDSDTQYISLTATLGLASSQDGMPAFLTASPDNRDLYAAQLKRMVIYACTSVKRRLRRCFDERSRQFLRLASAECVELPSSIRNARLDQLSKVSGTLSNRSATEGLARTTATLRGIRNAERAAKEAMEQSRPAKE